MIYYECRACGAVSETGRSCCGAFMGRVEDPDLDEEEFEYEQ